MKTLTELRKALKAIGYKVTTKTLSWGKHATYHTLDGQDLTGNVFTPDTLKTWKPLFDFIKEHKAEIDIIRENEEIRGLIIAS
jgi:hypothetical protein